jgi:AAA domain
MSEDWRDPADLAPDQIRIVPLPVFTAVEEPGVEAILGTLDQNLLPVGGDVMLYGDGGAGKTTLAIDLAFHLASGLDWLGIPVDLPRSVLLIENEGPRPLFRRKLRKRFAAWDGPPLGERLHVWEAPWAGFSFAEQELRAQLAQTIFEREIDLVIAGPVTQLGMEDAGTIREVRRFAENVAMVRERSLRPVASCLVHHEAKSGRVSGAWEGVGDTMIHVSGSGNGRTRFTIQKARWGSAYHGQTYRLRWADGQTFETDEDAEDRPALVQDAILAYVLEHGGCGWGAVEKAIGGRGEYARHRRDHALEDGLLIDTGKGEVKKGHRYELWHRDDPERPRTLAENGVVHTSGTTGTTGRPEEESRGSEGSRPVVPSDRRDDSLRAVSPPSLENRPDSEEDIEW